MGYELAGNEIGEEREIITDIEFTLDRYYVENGN